MGRWVGRHGWNNILRASLLWITKKRREDKGKERTQQREKRGLRRWKL